MQGGPSRKGHDKNELLLKGAHVLGDVSKFVVAIANYFYESLFTTWIPHLEGEEVFGYAKRTTNFSLRADDKLHRPNHVNFSHPHVIIPTCQPNNVDNLHIHGLPCVAQSMFPILSQGGMVVSEIMCGHGL